MMSDNNPNQSIYDVETPEEDLWFLPGAPDDADPALPPLPRTNREQLPEAEDWYRAENGQGRELARAASEIARLDEAVHARRNLSEVGSVLNRLALQEVAGLSWAEGQRVPVERLALYEVLRLSASDADHRDLALAGWAKSRLIGQRDPFQPEAFLGRVRVEADGLGDMGQRPVGEEFRALSDRWLDTLQGADLHPLTKAAFAYHLWRGLGLSGFEGVIEPSVIAARIGAVDQRTLSFLPMALAGVRGLTASGTPEHKLEQWYTGVTNSARAARLELDRLANWQTRAIDSISDLSGRVPNTLITALIAAPVLSAQAAQKHTGASRAAVQRNLNLFVKRGLAREITGQERYRFWGIAM